MPKPTELRPQGQVASPIEDMVAEGEPYEPRRKEWHTSVIVVLCSHFVVMNTWGFTNSFGAFQTYFTDALHRSPSTIAWIGSTQTFLLFFLGTITGRLTDAGHFRKVFFVGSLATVVGIFASSFCHRFEEHFVTLGIAVGVGNGCLFCPMLTVMSSYFDKRRAMAIGVAACGSASGGLVYSAMARQLLPSIGYPWTMRAITLIQFALLAVANLYLRPRMPKKKRSELIDWSAFRSTSYNFYAAASFFSLLSLYFSFFFLASYSRTALTPPMSYEDSLNLLLILNGVSVVGRLGSNYAADLFGTIKVFIPVAGAPATVLLAWIAVDSGAGIYSWAVACGICSGGVQSLFPAALTSLTADPQKLGIRIGMIFTIVSFSSLIGPPIGGSLINALGGRYLGAQVFAGVSMSLSTLFLVAAQRANH
ncbi:hypothetical protein FOYG_02354 [Fusarium oxysporum NRRL 32931]|uniref:Major facilitator superfamily (MFS) profile domain-containing protein n=1 Tax=Fusarium oxysporum NRRL 32931 TaxID=660029 RepID=W9IRF8_FUSOX|nr:hypothetical protein FOYG_02354 [Fusarium oxysporum NRRL 32931]